MCICFICHVFNNEPKYRSRSYQTLIVFLSGIKNDPEMRGVIPNSFEHIFQHISRSQDQQYLVRASYLEIYMEEIRDLLSKDQSKRLELKERPDTGVYVKVCGLVHIQIIVLQYSNFLYVHRHIDTLC